MLKVVILSASKYSSYTIAVAEGLLRNGVTIEAIVVKKLFNLERFLWELKSDPRRLFNKIIHKLIFKRFHAKRQIKDADQYDAIYAKVADLEEISKLYKIPIFYCNDFHSHDSLAYIDSLKCDLVVFTGGGILRAEILRRPKIGTINCHMGILPEYRGMDCFAWAILNNDYDNIGLTTHFIDYGIDTGDIIEVKRIDVRHMDNLPAVERFLELLMPEMMVDAVVKINAKKCSTLVQETGHGSQFFVMHPILRNIAKKKHLESNDR